MNFTGTEILKKREFYAQPSNVEFSIDCSVNSLEPFRIGVSGSKSIELLLSGGRVFDGDSFIYTYSTYQNLNFLIQSSEDSYNLFQNGVPLLIGRPIQTGHFSYFYVTRENQDTNMEFSVEVFGSESPSYTITQNLILTKSGQSAVTGYISNYGAWPLKVFQSNAIPPDGIEYNNFAGSIQNGESGELVFSGNFDSLTLPQSIFTQFYTSFDERDLYIGIVDARNFDRFVVINPLEFGFSENGYAQSFVTYTNYSGENISDYPTNLTITAEYVAGSGVREIDIGTVSYSINGFGSFFESGLLTGLYSVETGIGLASGFVFASGARFSWATGFATGIFVGVGTGLATGENYYGPAVGEFTAIITGLINNGSGTVQINGIHSGVADGAMAIGYTGYINATGYIDISKMQNGDYFYITSLTDPLIRGFQFFNETGLVSYLSGKSNVHKVKSYYEDGIVYLESLYSGTEGNGQIISPGNCGFGEFLSSLQLYGGENIGETGFYAVAVEPFWGDVQITLTGSGNYNGIISSESNATFRYVKTFTGAWDIKTGMSEDSLTSLKRPGFFDSNMISGSGLLPPNSFFIMAIQHNGDGFTEDTFRLTISGDNVVAPIQQEITN